MAEHSSNVFHSRLFTFRAGENGASTTVHSGAVAAVSTPLRLLMEEETPNGLRTSATLDGVREEDLLRFCDFCYTSTYTDPYPVVVKPATPAIENGSNNGDGASGSTSLVTTDDTTLQPPSSKRMRTESPAHSLNGFGKPGLIGASPNTDVASSLNVNNKIKLHSVFNNSAYTNTTARVFGANTRAKSNGISNNDNHTTVFIAHAAMHALAINYDITKLKTISLQKLNEKLVRFECTVERFGDVLALVRWVYKTEREMRRDMPELKDLVVRYVASEVSGFGKGEEFAALLQEGGLFVSDLWAITQSTLF
ncbi:hypothetical protein E4T39_02842 [Aureobasidium subglaciale]|nr:hypothetical protein E4T39_02842 [Aureobasidium subglaciale]